MKKGIIIAIVVSSLIALAPKVKALTFQDNSVVDAKKNWTIHFNQEVSFDDLSKQNIVVTDKNGSKVNVALQLGNDGKSIIVIPPDEGYDKGNFYKLNIGDKVHSKNSKSLKQQITMNFSIKEDIDNEIVTFKDKNLEGAVRNSINKHDGAIYEKDVKQITELCGQGREIKYLDGIEKLTNLQSIYLYGNSISDITPLKNLKELSGVYLYGNNISDLTPLKDLKKLTKIYLASNKINDVTPLEGLTNLQELDLSANSISNIGSLSGLINLQKLLINNYPIEGSNNCIKDFSQLAKLTNLQEFQVASNNITNTDFLKELKKLKVLNLSNNKINNISVLSNLINLEEVYIDNNEVEDIVALGNLTNLKRLGIRNDPIKDISAITKLDELEYMGFEGNLFDLDSLKQIKNLKEVEGYFVRDLNKFYLAYDKAKKIIKDIIKPGMSEFEKERAIHDYIVLNSKYDYDNKYPAEDDGDAYGILMNGTAVCQGYSYATELLLNMVGIRANIVVGDAKGGGWHAWNIVKINGKYYHLDTTWEKWDKENNISNYNYFNLSDKEMSKDHDWDTEKYPKCEDSLNEDGNSRYSIIKFKDPNFEKAVRSIINKPTGDIFLEDIEDVPNISYRPKDKSESIKDISGIENFKHLNGVYLDGNSIENIEPLIKIKRLRWLFLANNQITNIDVLSNLTNLEYMSISNNNVKNIDSLKNLNKLIELNIKGNPINQNDVDALRKVLSNCKLTF